MKKRLTALLLAAALMTGLCGGTALAAGKYGQAAGVPSPAAGAAEDETAAGTSYTPDPDGVLSFENLEARMRENSLDILALEANIAAIDAMDYEKLKDTVLESLNGLADYQFLLYSMGENFTASSMQSSYDSLRETYTDLREGKLQADNADIVRQLRNAQDQIVMVAQSLYIQYISLENSGAALDRQMAALDRNIQVAQLSYEQGNVSALTLEQAKSGRVQLVSGRASLDMGMDVMAIQLQSMVGMDLTGQLTLTALPKVTDEMLDAMDEEADLAAAKEASYSLLSALRTYEEAKETYDDAVDEYGVNSTKYQFTQAKHTWKAAQLTYQSAVRNFEMQFRTLYRQVKDYKQVLEAARTALTVEEQNYAAAQLKYDQGRISKNALLDAADVLAAARDKVDAAVLDLFTGYNNYRWAVGHGILN